MVDQVRSPFWGECVSNGCNRLMKGRGQFMLGLSDLRVRAEAPGGKLSIGRVAEHHVNACCRQQCVNLAEVAFNDLDAILQSVELRSPPSPVGQGSLDLKPGYAKIRIPIGQQEGDRAVSAAEIKDLIGGSRYGKFRQQQRIHRMVEACEAPTSARHLRSGRMPMRGRGCSPAGQYRRSACCRLLDRARRMRRSTTAAGAFPRKPTVRSLGRTTHL